MSGKDCDSFKIMLVEDDDGFRRTVAESLRSRFPYFALDEAADASEAMKKAASFLPQLIFMDIKLPGQSGLVLTRQLKTLHPEIQVVILTSYDFPEYRDAARARGAFGFLSKGSFMAHQLHDLVEELWTKWKISCLQPV